MAGFDLGNLGGLGKLMGGGAGKSSDNEALTKIMGLVQSSGTIDELKNSLKDVKSGDDFVKAIIEAIKKCASMDEVKSAVMKMMAK